MNQSVLSIHRGVARYTLATVALLLVPLCYSCTKHGGSSTADITWDTVTLQVIDSVEESREKAYFIGDFTLLFPQEHQALAQEIRRVALGDEASTLLTDREALKSFATRMEQAFLSDSTYMGTTSQQTVSMITTIPYKDAHVATLCIDVTTRNNNEEAFHSRRYCCFALEKGEALGERSLFVEGYEEQLHRLLLEEAEESFPGVVFITDELTPNGNFAIKKAGIQYCFSTETVAPQLNHNNEAVELLLPWKRLTAILATPSPVSHLE